MYIQPEESERNQCSVRNVVVFLWANLQLQFSVVFLLFFVFTDIIVIFHVSVTDRICIIWADIFFCANIAIFVPASVNP